MTTARVTEIISASTESFDHAFRSGIERASKTLENVTGAWIADQEAVVANGKIEQYRVRLKVTFVLTD